MLQLSVEDPAKKPEAVKSSAATVLLGVAPILNTLTTMPALAAPRAIARASFSVPPHMLS